MPFIDLSQFDYSDTGAVRIRASAPDPLSGLRGHAYIAARKLGKPSQRLNCCPADLLAAVLNIQTAHRERRRQALIATAPVWDMNDDESLARLHQLIDLEDTGA